MTQNFITIIQALQLFSDTHPNVKRFKTAFFEQMDQFSSSDNTWPILYAIPSTIQFNENVSNYAFRIYCIDVMLKDRSNEDPIKLATSEILRDLIIWIKSKENPLNIINTPTLVPYNNGTQDYTSGWYMDVTIQGVATMTECALPFPNFGISGITCDYTYINNYLTCTTLEDCPVIIDLQNQIDKEKNISF